MKKNKEKTKEIIDFIYKDVKYWYAKRKKFRYWVYLPNAQQLLNEHLENQDLDEFTFDILLFISVQLDDFARKTGNKYVPLKAIRLFFNTAKKAII